MSKKFFILLEEFHSRPTTEIGLISKSISNLSELGVSVPKAICIPQNTLKLIAQTNNLNTKAHKLIQETNFNSYVSKNKTALKLKQLINKQKIPTELSKEFLNIYHNNLKSSFVAIQNAAVIGSENILIQNIKGDTNVVDVILELWSRLIETSFNKLDNKPQNLDKFLFPSPILIRQQIDTQASGKAFTFDQRDGSKKKLTIKASLGVTNQESNYSSSYYLDSETLNLVDKTKIPQTSKFTRDLEELKKQNISATYQDQDILTTQQINELATIIKKVGRSSLDKLEIEWGFQNNVFFIYHIKEAHYIKTIEKVETIKKTYVSTTNNRDQAEIQPYADGIAILNSGQLLSMLGEHPMHTAKSSKSKLLTSAIAKTISKYVGIKNNLHLIYRSQNSTSKQLAKLKYSTNYEASETNPDLGLRGAAKIIGQPQIFNLELDIIKKILKNSNSKISLLIPFARSVSEVIQVINLVEKSGLNTNNKFDIWLELSTPENILNLSNYPLNKIGGFVFNTKNIYSLILGVDMSSPDSFAKYPINMELISSLINKVKKTTDNFSKTKSLLHNHQLIIDLTNFNIEFIKNITSQNINGVIVNPQVTAVAKKCIINEEINK